MIELGKSAHDKSFLHLCVENAELKKKLKKAIKALKALSDLPEVRIVLRELGE